MLPSVFLSGIFGVVLTVAICIILGLPLAISLQDSGISIGMGIFQVGAGLVLYTLGSKALPAVELTLMSLAEVLLAPLWVWLLLGEMVTSNTLAGGCVFLGLLPETRYSVLGLDKLRSSLFPSTSGQRHQCPGTQENGRTVYDPLRRSHFSDTS